MIFDKLFKIVNLVEIFELFMIVSIGCCGFFNVLFSVFNLVVNNGFV